MNATTTPPVPSRAWPTRLVLVGAACGFFIATEVKGMVPGGLAVMVLLFGIWQTVAGAISAAVLLAMAAFKRSLGQAPRMVVGQVGGGLLLATSATFTYAVDSRMVVLCVIALALVIVALRRRHEHWRPALALPLLVVSIATVHVPREIGWTSVKRTSDTTRRVTNTVHKSECDAVNWDGPNDLAALAHRHHVTPRLTGNVGEMVHEAREVDGDGTLMLTAQGHVEVSWLRCFMPLYKSVELSLHLPFDGTVTARNTDGGYASCTVSGTLDVQLEHTSLGVASCRDLRVALGRQIEAQLNQTAETMTIPPRD